MKSIIFFLLLAFFNGQSNAQENLSFGIVPQQSATKLAHLWTPIINQISQQSGFSMHFSTAPYIPTFEKYLTEAIPRASDKKIQGIIVVSKKSDINSLQDLQKSTLAFPAPGPFAAKILTQSALNEEQVTFSAKYVSSYDSVSINAAKRIYPADDRILDPFNNVIPEIRDQLQNIVNNQGVYTSRYRNSS